MPCDANQPATRKRFRGDAVAVVVVKVLTVGAAALDPAQDAQLLVVELVRWTTHLPSLSRREHSARAIDVITRLGERTYGRSPRDRITNDSARALS